MEFLYAIPHILLALLWVKTAKTTKKVARKKSRKKHTNIVSVTDKYGHKMTFRIKKNGGLQRLGRCYQHSNPKARF